MSESQEAKPPSPAKKPYASPTFTEYGNVSKLTMAGGSTAKESGVPQKKAGCL